MKGYRLIHWLLLAILVGSGLYLYFSPYETHTMYGDDLNFYQEHVKFHTLKDWLGSGVFDLKFRPVTGLITRELIHYFDRDLHGYFIFNVLVQTGVVFMFTLVADLLGGSLILSFLAGLLIGMSRFALYNINQLFWGGCMEGLAIILFLGVMYCLLRTFTRKEHSAKQNFAWLLAALFIANLSLYTHERYVVLLPCVVFCGWFFPYARRLAIGHKVTLLSLAVISITINILVKKYIYGLSFLMGTGGQQLHADLLSALVYLSEGILSILQINAGNESMIGISAIKIPFWFQLIILALGIYMLVLLRNFLRDTRQNEHGSKDPYAPRTIMIFLTALLFLSMSSAVITIRLEQRWLQAPFCVFLLMLLLAVRNIKTYTPAIRNGSFAVFLVVLIFTDHTYLRLGDKKLFMVRSEKLVTDLVAATRSGVIKANAGHMYFEEDWWLFSEWVTNKGYLFKYYGYQFPPIKFVNDLRLNDSGYTSPLPDFHPGIDQVIRIKENSITDITDRYIH